MGFIHDKLDIKFLILYITSRLAGPVDFTTLAELSFCDEGVSYFEFAEALAELVDTQHLDLGEDQRYTITDKGRRNGAICESSLAFSVRQRCEANLARINAVLRRDAQIRTETLPREDGSGVTLRQGEFDDPGYAHRLPGPGKPSGGAVPGAAGAAVSKNLAAAVGGGALRGRLF